MTNSSHQKDQYYQGDPRAQQFAGADGRFDGFEGRVPSPYEGGQGYASGYIPQQPYQGQLGQGPQGHQTQHVQSGRAHQSQPGQAQSYDPYAQGQQTQSNQAQPIAYNQYGRPVYAYPQAYVQPATSQSVQVKQKRSRRVIVISIIVALVCIALAVAIFVLMQEAPSTRQGTRGQLEGKTDEEIQAELDRQVEEGMFNISIASVVEFENGDAEGELRIENVPGNKYLMQVNITRDDTGDVIYTTDMIEPDYHVQRDSLDVSLPAGTYPCTAVFSAYDPDTEQQIGQAAAKITVQVKS